jgi:peptidyl-prolyl cis-trans isomerase B (cyclophilin B)
MLAPVPRLPALLSVLVCLALAAVAAGCSDSSTIGSGSETATPAATDAAACPEVAAPKARGEGDERKPTLRLKRGTTYVATVRTSCGTFAITLDPARAPVTGGSFVTLARSGFYDGTTFHRIVADFVIQGGDPKGDGTGGPGYSVEEAPPSDLRYAEGVVAMAKAGDEPPGTSGSQFFVVTGAGAAQLPPDYALLGKVTSGMDVVQRIGATDTDPTTDAPLSPVVIRSIKITTS